MLYSTLPLTYRTAEEFILVRHRHHHVRVDDDSLCNALTHNPRARFDKPKPAAFCCCNNRQREKPKSRRKRLKRKKKRNTFFIENYKTCEKKPNALDRTGEGFNDFNYLFFYL